MTAKTCPKCGALQSSGDSNHVVYDCNSYFESGEARHESWLCITRQRDALERRVRELEEALQNMMVFDTPIRRLNFPGEFYDEACASARYALEKKGTQ